MNRIIIDYPDDCTEHDAAVYATGCFNQHQNDYKKLQEGYRFGCGLTFGDGRDCYLYRTSHGNYVMKLMEKEAK